MCCNSKISWLICCAHREFIINCCTLEYIIVFRSNIASLSNNERKVDFKRRRYIQTKNKKQNNKAKNKTKNKTKQKQTNKASKKQTNKASKKQTNKASKKQNKKTPKAKQNMAYEQFEGTKRVIGRLKSKKDIQYNE